MMISVEVVGKWNCGIIKYDDDDISRKHGKYLALNSVSGSANSMRKPVY